MRMILLVVWLILPIGGWAYHEGPGQDHLALERCDAAILAARAAVDAEDWAAAIAGYEGALAELPGGNEPLAMRLRLELDKARIENRGLVEAREDLEILVDQLLEQAAPDHELLADARQALARAQFFKTWLMRLEGVTREEWEPEIEAARQNWRLLAEQARTEAERSRHQQDLEAAVRLARLEMEDLQGLPLPSQ